MHTFLRLWIKDIKVGSYGESEGEDREWRGEKKNRTRWVLSLLYHKWMDAA